MLFTLIVFPYLSAALFYSLWKKEKRSHRETVNRLMQNYCVARGQCESEFPPLEDGESETY